MLIRCMIAVTLVVAAWGLGAGARASHFLDKPLVVDFIDEMVAEHEFDAGELEALFESAEYKQSIIDAISRPAEKRLTWAEYQDIFLDRKRIASGRKFWAEHRSELTRAEGTYGVPASIITAVIGVETLYGRYMGRYRVLDALSTLAFDYPKRAPFFRNELKEFLLLVREEKREITSLLGSYAGAMGYGQFIPSSYRNYAVDFDGDGARDIWLNSTDAIGSVANYLSAHGWQAGMPITGRARVSGDGYDRFFNDELKPSVTVAELAEGGVFPVEEYGDDLVTAPIHLRGKAGSEYWLGLTNFYVITRYNHSKLYAMAVFQLSRRIEQAL